MLGGRPPRGGAQVDRAVSAGVPVVPAALAARLRTAVLAADFSADAAVGVLPHLRPRRAFIATADAWDACCPCWHWQDCRRSCLC